jgi:hypothetical protein
MLDKKTCLTSTGVAVVLVDFGDMIFPIRCPYLFADHYPENRIQVCIATRDRLTTKSRRSSVCMSTLDFVCENLKHVLPDQSRP